MSLRTVPQPNWGMSEEDLIAEVIQHSQTELRLDTLPEDQRPAYDDVLATVSSLFTEIVNRENLVFARSHRQQIITKVVDFLMGGKSFEERVDDPPDP